MAANTKIVGKVYNINTTGFIASNLLVVKGWVQTRYSTGSALISTGSVIVDRANKVPVIGAKGGTGQTIVVPLMGLAVRGLSCTSLVAGTTVRIYLE